MALDTTYILGRGAVKDTYNLLSDGVVELMRALSEFERSDLVEWAAENGYQRYVGSSVKGDACIDWDDKTARAALLGRIVGDADRLLELSRRAQGLLDEESAGRQRIVQGSELLGQLLLQDVERIEEGVGLKEGVSRDRIVSVHDPEMRHGHKSSSKRFDGHKASVAVDTDSQVITAVDVLPGNASDNVGALEMVERSEEGTISAVEETIGDAAYGDGGTRQAFADAGRTLIAKLPRRPDSKRFPKEDFEIDLESGTCTCPAGHTTRKLYRMGTRTDRTGRTHQLRAFWFDAAVCGACPLRERCVGSARGSGRTVRLHPQEALLQQARALQRSEGYAEYRQRRVVVEHRLARLVQLGVRQARVLRARQDAVSAVDGGDGGQPDAGGWQSRDDGRSSNRLSVLQLLSHPYIHDLAVRHSYRPETIADTDNLSLAITIALRSTGFSSALLAGCGKTVL